jgi:hypothetical protein
VYLDWWESRFLFVSLRSRVGATVRKEGTGKGWLSTGSTGEDARRSIVSSSFIVVVS